MKTLEKVTMHAGETSESIVETTTSNDDGQ